MLREYIEMKVEIKNSKTSVEHAIQIWLIQAEKTNKRNGIETIVDNEGILCLNEKHIEERLDKKTCEKLE